MKKNIRKKTQRYLKYVLWILIPWTMVFSHYPLNPSLDTFELLDGNLETAKIQLNAGIIDEGMGHLLPLVFEGSPEAQYLLAQQYHAEHENLKTYAFDKDVCSATYWYDKAARQNYAPAQFEMSWAYNGSGDGVIPNDGKSYFWLLLAEKNGYEFQKNSLLQLERKLTTEEMTTIAHKVSTWDPRQEPPADIYRLPHIDPFTAILFAPLGITPCGTKVSWIQTLF